MVGDVDDGGRKFIDLFAGCGGLSLGLEHAGFKPIFVSELDNNALETYKLNRRELFPLLDDDRFWANDVKEITGDKRRIDRLKKDLLTEHNVDVLGSASELDLLVGGPPCQGYSGIGHRRSYSVNKELLPSNHLFSHMATLVGELRPKLFLFENVRGLMNARWTKDGEKGEIWADVQAKFEKIEGYFTRSSLVFAKHYGVPQNRPRLLLVGIRDDVKSRLSIGEEADAVASGLLPIPSGSHPPHLEDILSDLIDTEYVNGGKTTRYPSTPQTEMQEKLRLGIDGKLMVDDSLTEQEYSKHSEDVIKKFQHMRLNNGEIPPEYRTKKFAQRVLQPAWKDSGPNITATSLPDDYVHWAQPRILTVREWARLQMFPDWYEFAGNRTTGGIRRAGNPREANHFREVPKYTQIGNAVPVALAEAVGKHFVSLLSRARS